MEAMHELDLGGVHAFLAIHDTSRGPAFGGIRCMRYTDQAAAWADAARLAEGMSLKLAAAEVPAGGGKTVIIAQRGMDRRGVYASLAAEVEELGGAYVCGPDVGTTEADLEVMREVTRHVNPRGNDPGRATAVGVVAAIQGLLRHLHDDSSPAGRTFAVQGLGSVGLAVARELVALGGRVVASDPDADARDRAAALGIGMVPEAKETPCDVFVPCALGGVLDGSALPTRAVCGSANNQLTSVDAAKALHAQGVVYVPDFLANAGAVVEGFYTITQGDTELVRAKARAHIDRTENRVADLLREAESSGLPPLEVALLRWV